MKIALFHNLPPGGAKRALWEHARLLRERGHVLDAYSLATATEDYLPLAPLCRSVFVQDAPPEAPLGRVMTHPLMRPLWRLAGQNVEKMVGETRRVRREIARLEALEAVYTDLARRIDAGGYDLVYVHHCRLLLSPFLLRQLQTPSVYFCQDTLRHIHEWAVEEHPDYDRTPEKLGLSKVRGFRVPIPVLRQWWEQDRRNTTNARAATLVLANSSYSREAILRTMGINAHVCDLGIDSKFFRPDSTVHRENLVLSVGSIAALKRHDFILDAIATIPQSRRPVLRIVGYDPVRYGQAGHSPEAERLLKRAQERGVELRLSKEVTDEALRAAYQSAGVVAFAPYLEPFGFVPLEAGACGAPVVGVREAGVRETITEGVNGFLTERDSVEFGAALDRVLSDSLLAERLGSAGRRTVCERWTWERSADLLEGFFARVTSPKSETAGHALSERDEVSCASL